MNIRQQLNDWCHLCGRRCTYTAAIHYASNAEHDPCGPLTNYVRACAACADAIGIAARGNSKPPPAVSRFRDPLWSEFRGQL